MKIHRWRSALALLILWLAFGLRLYHLDFQSIWWDEGHSIFVASHAIFQIPTLPAMDVHPPAYFSLLHLWMALTGQSEFALRYLSVIFSLLTVALLWRFTASITAYLASLRAKPEPKAPCGQDEASPPRLTASPLLAALLAAVSPLYVAYAQEVRSYAMITFLALASTFILWHMLFPLSRPAVSGQWSAVALYIFLTAACLYTHYFTIFLLLFHNLAWLGWAFLGPQKNRASRLARWIASQVGIFLLFTPQLLLTLRQVTSYTNPNLTPPSLSEFLSRSWQAYTVGLTIGPLSAQWGMGLIAGVLGLALLRQWLQTLPAQAKTTSQRQASPSPQGGVAQSRPSGSLLGIWNMPYPAFPIMFLVGWFLMPLAAYFIVLQRQPSFEPRYMILVTPALFLLLALSLGQGLGIRSQTSNATPPPSHIPYLPSLITPAALSLLLLAIFLTGLYSYYTNETYFKDDSAGVAAWLAAETTANDLVYVDVPHPFHYYVAKGQIAAPTRYLFVDIHTAADTLTREAAGRDRLYWITWRGSDTDPRGVIPFLAQKYGRQLGQRSFRGYDGVWFSLPDPATVFSVPTRLKPAQANFGDVLRLDGVAYGGLPPSANTIAPPNPAWATLHFTLLRQTEIDYKVSLRLRSEAGQVVAQVDKDLLNDRHFRTSAWPVADPALNQAINVYTLPIAADTAPGLYRLEVIVYNAHPPYPSEGVTGPESAAGGSAALMGHISVIP